MEGTVPYPVATILYKIYLHHCSLQLTGLIQYRSSELSFLFKFYGNLQFFKFVHKFVYNIKVFLSLPLPILSVKARVYIIDLLHYRYLAYFLRRPQQVKNNCFSIQESVTRSEWHDLFWLVHSVCVWDDKVFIKENKIRASLRNSTRQSSIVCSSPKDENMFLNASFTLLNNNLVCKLLYI